MDKMAALAILAVSLLVISTKRLFWAGLDWSFFSFWKNRRHIRFTTFFYNALFVRTADFAIFCVGLYFAIV